MDKIDTLLDSFKAFPTAPQILPPLLQALGEDNVNLARIVDLVSVDPALTAQILKTCNSAFFSRSTSIDSVHDAVNQLGLQTVYCIVAGTTGSQLFTSTQPANSAADWWRNAVMTAFASQFVAEGVNAEPGAMFTAGLLHDFGKVLLWQAFQADYARLLEEPGLTEPEIAKREAAAFGIDHAEVGGRLLARWHFSHSIVTSVWAHDNPLKMPEGNERRLAACVHLGNALAQTVNSGKTDPTTPAPEPPVSMTILNQSLEDLSRYKDLIMENMNFVEAMCHR